MVAAAAPRALSRLALASLLALGLSGALDARARAGEGEGHEPWEGFRVATEDGRFSLRVEGDIQVDGRFAPGVDADVHADGVELRRLRPRLSGAAFGLFAFMMNFDFGRERALIQDGWLRLDLAPELRIRVGRARTPLSLEFLQSSLVLPLAERSFPTQLAGGRDVGLDLTGLVGGLLDWQLGVVNGTPDGVSAAGARDRFDVHGRLLFFPFARADVAPLKRLALGVAGSYGVERGVIDRPGLGSLRSIGRATFFRYAAGETAESAAVADGDRLRLAFHGTWYVGPVGVSGELIRSSQQVRLGEVRETAARTAWQVSLTAALTGEEASFRGFAPTRRFDPAAGTWGAVAVSARLAGVRVADDVFTHGFADPQVSASSALAWSAGVEWLFAEMTKLQVVFERTTFEGGAAGEGGAPAGDRPAESLLLVRMQLSL